MPSSQPGPEEQLARLCDATIMDRLSAPSTYRRIATHDVQCRSASFKELEGRDYPEKAALDRWHLSRNDDMRDSRQTLERQAREEATISRLMSLRIDYDAANAYGTPIRSTSVCAVTVFDCEDPGLDDEIIGPMVDGFIRSDWYYRGVMRRQNPDS